MSAVISSIERGILGYRHLIPQGIYSFSQTVSDPGFHTLSTPFKNVWVSQDMIGKDMRFHNSQFDLGLLALPFYGKKGASYRLSSRPLTSPYDGQKDFNRYGSTIHSIASSISILSGSPPGYPIPAKEQDTRHYNWSGAGSYSPITPTPDIQLIDYLAWVGYGGASQVVHNAPWFNGPNIYAFNVDEVNYSWDIALNYRMNKVLPLLRDFGVFNMFGYNFQSITQVSDTPESLEFTLEASIYFEVTDCLYEYTYDFLLNKQKTIGSIQAQFSWPWYSWSVEPSGSLTFRKISCTRPVDLTPPTFADIFLPCYLGTRKNYIHQAFEGEYLSNLSSTRKKVWSLSSSFFEEIKLSYKHLLAASSFSTAEALKELENGIGNNVLQTLFKIPSISSAMPMVKESVGLLSHIAKRDLSLATLKEILDIASATTLQASFQWRPMKDLLLTHLPEIRRLSYDMSSPRKARISHGKWRYTFREGELSRPAQLTARTKIVLDESPRGLLATILGIDAFGVMPKPSNIWDLLPFTFVVNWLTGVGEAMRRVEYSSVLLGISAYYVHTYTIQSAFTSDELQNWSIASTSTEGVGMKVTFRDISLYTPIPLNSRFGFGLPTKAPPLGVVLALLYQLFIR